MKPSVLPVWRKILRWAKALSEYQVVLLLACVAYAAYFFLLNTQDHFALRTHFDDLGNMTQAIWSISQGDMGMTVTHPQSPPHSRLQEHANLIFYIIGPFYFLWQSPLLLFAIASIAPPIGAYTLFLLSKKLMPDEKPGFIIALLYLWNPMLHDVVLFDFHAIVLATALIPLMIYFAEVKKWHWYWVSAIFLLSLKEDMPLLLFALAPFVFLRHNRRIGLYTAATALSYWFFLRWGLPRIVGASVAEYNWYRFGNAGSTPEEILINIFRRPDLIFQQLISRQKIHYLIALFIQSGFIPVITPTLAIAALPNVFQNLIISSDWQAKFVGIYYSTAICVVLVGAFLYSFAKIYRKYPSYARGWLYIYALYMFAYGMLFTPAPHGTFSYWSDFGSYYDKGAFREALSLIPPTASVSAQNNLGPHLTHRPRAFNIRTYRQDNPEYIIFHIENPLWRNQKLFYERGAEHYVSLYDGQNIESIFDHPDYGLLYQKSSFYVFKRGYEQTNNESGRKALESDISRYRASIQKPRPTSSLEVRITNFVFPPPQ